MHKGQGISCGKGKPDEFVEVGLGGKRGSPGLELVALSRATEMIVMVIYDDIPMTLENSFSKLEGEKDMTRNVSSNRN